MTRYNSYVQDVTKAINVVCENKRKVYFVTYCWCVPALFGFSLGNFTKFWLKIVTKLECLGWQQFNRFIESVNTMLFSELHMNF